MRPPLISPLFPYTTLFRSRRDRAVHPAAVSFSAGRRALDEFSFAADHPAGFSAHLNQQGGPRQMKIRRERVDQPDRKSTRLNSSHTVISYAVFCLKKKKKN